MPLLFQSDDTTYSLDHQCMLGDWFLLAAYTQDVYLPAGRWIDYWSGEEINSQGQGKRNCTWPETVGGALFVKGGAMIPMGPVAAHVDQEPLEIVTLDVYPDGHSTFTLYEDDGVTNNYQQEAHTTTDFHCLQELNRIRLDIGRRNGRYDGMLQRRGYLLRFKSSETVR